MSTKSAGMISAAFFCASRRSRTMPSARESRSTIRRCSSNDGSGISSPRTKSMSALGIRAPAVFAEICETIGGDRRKYAR